MSVKTNLKSLVVMAVFWVAASRPKALRMFRSSGLQPHVLGALPITDVRHQSGRI